MFLSPYFNCVLFNEAVIFFMMGVYGVIENSFFVYFELCSLLVINRLLTQSNVNWYLYLLGMI